MAEKNGLLESAVIVPELADEVESPRLSIKRRNSSIAEEDTKRPRLSPKQNENALSPPASARIKEPQEWRASKDVDERKRGRRLFGALLGTLSQNSSSTAQKRRVDIEKKQQEKLKLQAEEYDENKKREQESLLEVRRVEQVKYREQSTLIRHSNTLAAANFLLTKAEPKLYYKPWELRSEEEATIKSQLAQAQAWIDGEVATDADQDTNAEGEVLDSGHDPAKQKEEQEGTDIETVGDAADEIRPFDQLAGSHTNDRAELTKASAEESAEVAPTSKDNVDDGGDDVVEGEEDNVIY